MCGGRRRTAVSRIPHDRYSLTVSVRAGAVARSSSRPAATTLRRRARAPATLASVGKIASPSQGAGYYARDGYDAKDGPAHKGAARWGDKGAEAPGLSGPVDPDTFRQILEGRVPPALMLGMVGKRLRYQASVS